MVLTAILGCFRNFKKYNFLLHLQPSLTVKFARSLACALNLKKLNGFAQPSWLTDLSVSNLIKEKIVRKLEFHFDMYPAQLMRSTYEKFLEGEPQLLEIRTGDEEFLWNTDDSDENYMSAKIFSSILQSSCDSIQSLEITLKNLIRLQNGNLLPQMSSLNTLVLYWCSTETLTCNDHGLVYLNALDYSTYFPNLKRLEFTLDHKGRGESLPIDVAGSENSVSSTVNELVVTYLSYSWNFTDRSCKRTSYPQPWKPFEKFAQVFPNVCHICLNHLQAHRYWKGDSLHCGQCGLISKPSLWQMFK